MARWPTPSQSAAMISICLLRERMFMAGPIRHVGGPEVDLEMAQLIRYIVQYGHDFGVLSRGC
jgi:hypothetical protein